MVNKMANPQAKERAKGEFFARSLRTTTTVDKTSVSIKKPAKSKNSLPKGKRQISRQRKSRIKSA